MTCVPEVLNDVESVALPLDRVAVPSVVLVVVSVKVMVPVAAVGETVAVNVSAVPLLIVVLLAASDVLVAVVVELVLLVELIVLVQPDVSREQRNSNARTVLLRNVWPFMRSPHSPVRCGFQANAASSARFNSLGRKASFRRAMNPEMVHVLTSVLLQHSIAGVTCGSASDHKSLWGIGRLLSANAGVQTGTTMARLERNHERPCSEFHSIE